MRVESGCRAGLEARSSRLGFRAGSVAILGVVFLLAPMRGALAGTGPVQVVIDTKFAEVNNGFIHDLGLYIGVDTGRNAVWSYSPVTGSQTVCPAPTPAAGLDAILRALELPGSGVVGQPQVYVAEGKAGKIWQVDPLSCAGQELTPPLPPNATIGPMAWGPDLHLWVVANVTPGGAVVMTLDPEAGTFTQPTSLPGGPVADMKQFNGSMVLTNVGDNEVDQLTPSMSATRYRFNGPGFGTLGGLIAGGCDGALWFTYGYYVAAMTTAEKFYFFDAPGSGLLPDAIATDAYQNVWFSLVGNSYALSVIDASSIPSDFSHATFYSYDTGDDQVAQIVPVPFPSLLAPTTRGLDFNPPQPFACPSPLLAAMVNQGGRPPLLGELTGWQQSSCSQPPRGNELLVFVTPVIRGFTEP